MFLAQLPFYLIELYRFVITKEYSNISSHGKEAENAIDASNVTTNYVDLSFRAVFIIYRVYSDKYLMHVLLPCTKKWNKKKNKKKDLDPYKG